MAKNNEGAGAPKIDRAVQARIGHELRAMYDELLKQPLPDKLLETLRAADDLQVARQQLGEAAQAMRRATIANTESAASLAANKRAGRRAPDALPKAKGA